MKFDVDTGMSVDEYNRIIRRIIRNFRYRYPNFTLIEAKKILLEGTGED